MNRQDLLVGVPEAQDVVAVIELRIYILRGIERRTDVRVGVDLSHDSSVSSLALPTRFGGRYISELIEEIFMRLFDFGALAPAWLLAVGVLSRAGVAGVYSGR